MSSNAELVRDAFERWNRGDLEGLLARIHGDFRLRTAGLFLGLAEEYVGPAGFTAFWDEFRAAWSEISIRVHELEDDGDGVYAATTFHGLGREGMRVQRAFYLGFRVRDRKLVLLKTSGEPGPARAAAGL